VIAKLPLNEARENASRVQRFMATKSARREALIQIGVLLRPGFSVFLELTEAVCFVFGIVTLVVLWVRRRRSGERAGQDCLEPHSFDEPCSPRQRSYIRDACGPGGSRRAGPLSVDIS
jgi:hypothetical protein